MLVQMYKPNVNVGHVVPGVSLHRVKERLSLVHGSIVEAPLVRCHRHYLHLGSLF